MKRKRVLIAEDDPVYAELLVEELNVIDTKMEILIKKDGQEVKGVVEADSIRTARSNLWRW